MKYFFNLMSNCHRFDSNEIFHTSEENFIQNDEAFIIVDEIISLI